MISGEVLAIATMIGLVAFWWLVRTASSDKQKGELFYSEQSKIQTDESADSRTAALDRYKDQVRLAQQNRSEIAGDEDLMRDKYWLIRKRKGKRGPHTNDRRRFNGGRYR